MTDFGKGRRRDYHPDDIEAALSTHALFRVAGMKLEDMTVAQLAYWSLSAQSERHRLGCVAQLLKKANRGHEVRAVLTSLKKRDS